MWIVTTKHDLVNVTDATRIYFDVDELGEGHRDLVVKADFAGGMLVGGTTVELADVAIRGDIEDTARYMMVPIAEAIEQNKSLCNLAELAHQMGEYMIDIF